VRTAARFLLRTLLAWSAPRPALAQTTAPADLGAAAIEDRRYRTINARAYTNPEELIGAPQNPRRVSAGCSLRMR
jgi:hypothetical protein